MEVYFVVKVILLTLVYIIGLLVSGCSTTGVTPSNTIEHTTEPTTTSATTETTYIEETEVIEETTTSVENEKMHIRANIIGTLPQYKGVVATQDDYVFYVYNDGLHSRLVREKLDGYDINDIKPNEIKSPWSINVVGDWIYFVDNRTTFEQVGFSHIINQDSKLFKMKIDGSELTKLTDDDVNSVIVVEDHIYFVNSSDGGRIYRVDVDGSNERVINNDNSMFLNIYKSKIYYINNTGRDSLWQIRKMDLDGSNNQLLIEANVASQLKVYNDRIYYTSLDSDYNSTISSVALDGTDKKNHTRRISVSTYNVFGNDIYYTIYDTGINKTNLDGGSNTKISVDSPNDLVLLNGCIFYTANDRAFAMDLNGNNRKRLSLLDGMSELLQNAPDISEDDSNNLGDDVSVLRFGEEFRLSNWNVVIKKYNFNNKISVNKGNISSYIESDKGMTFLVLHLKIENTGTNSEVFLKYDDDKEILLIYDRQYNYSYGRSTLDNDLTNSYDNTIKPLQSKEGIIYFEVPEKITSHMNKFELFIEIKNSETYQLLFYE